MLPVGQIQALEDRALLAAVVTHYDASALALVADGTQIAQFDDISGYSNHATPAPGSTSGRVCCQRDRRTSFDCDEWR